MKQNKKALYLQKETYEQFKFFSKFNNFNNSEAINNLLHDSSYFKLTNLQIEQLKNISETLINDYELNKIDFDTILKLKSIIERIEDFNK
jgi:hypothetical protein